MTRTPVLSALGPKKVGGVKINAIAYCGFACCVCALKTKTCAGCQGGGLEGEKTRFSVRAAVPDDGRDRFGNFSCLNLKFPVSFDWQLL